jgi:Bacterial Ig-like domain (group 3)
MAALASAVLCVLAFGLAGALADTDYTWTGLATPGDAWSDANNWQDLAAPSGSVGTLTFPALTGANASTLEQSADDSSSLSADGLSIDDATPYNIFDATTTGGPLTLGSGGVVATTTQGAFAPPQISLPIVLGQAQTWSIDGGPAGVGEVIFDGGVSGSSSALSVQLANAGYLDLDLGSDNEVGDVSVTGANAGDTGINAYANGALELVNDARLDATDGNTVDVTNAAVFGSGTLGTLTVTGGAIDAGNPLGTLAVNGAATFDSGSAVVFAIADGGSTAGTDYSQLKVSGNVSLGGARLGILGADAADDCPTLTAGNVDTLLTTTGTLSGTFANLPNGATTQLSCAGSTTTVEINYTSNAVTATAGPIPTSTALTTSQTSPTAGQAVTLTATVTAGSEPPAGTVEFESNGAAISGCGAIAVAGASATCNATFATAGQYVVQAIFNPASSGVQSPSSSPSVSLSVQSAPAPSTPTPGKPSVSPSPGSTKGCVVPGMKGLTLTQAKRALKLADCRLGKARQPKRVPRNHVLHVSAQSVKRGARLPALFPINVTLTAVAKH